MPPPEQAPAPELAGKKKRRSGYRSRAELLARPFDHATNYSSP